jgi:hypothetical protein
MDDRLLDLVSAYLEDSGLFLIDPDDWVLHDELSLNEVGVSEDGCWVTFPC